MANRIEWGSWPEESEDSRWSVGRHIRVMCDIGGGLPLWDEDGRLPEDDEFVYGVLGLQASLVADLRAWSDALEGNEPIDISRWEAQGRSLAGRLADILGGKYSVELILPKWAP